MVKAKFTYVGIRVIDLQQSIDFYTKLLDMKVRDRSKIEQTKGEVVSLESKDGGFSLELNYYEKGSPHYAEYVVGEGLDHLAFNVDNLTKALEETRSLGYQVVLEMKTSASRWAYIKDPNGIWIELF
jgi:lactoylglutathione lyase